MATKKKPTTKKPPGKRFSDIPLENIPDRIKLSYTPEKKLEAVNRVKAGEGAEAVARDMGIANGGLIHKWAKIVAEGKPLKTRGGNFKSDRKPLDLAAGLRAALENAQRERDERIEVAASIVEADGGTKEALDLAKRIRALKRPKT